MRTARTEAIWILALLAMGIVGALMADRLFSLGWDRLHSGPLAFVAGLCVLVCLWLMRQSSSPSSS
jgi:hypothetical protein